MRLLSPFDPATDPLSGPLRRYLETGDEAAIEEVVRATRPRLLAAARRIGVPDDAEDAVQTAFLSLVRRRGASLDAPLLPWLLTATIRSAYRKKALSRRERGLAERLALAPAAPAERIGSDEIERLRREVGRLPARYRDAVVLHDLAGLSTADVAGLLDLPEATVRTRLFRARRLVRSRWSPAVVSGLLSVPWFLLDRGRDAASGSGALAAGGVMSLKVAAPMLLIGLAVGAGAAYLARPSPAGDDAARARRAEAEVLSLREQVKALSAGKAEAGREGAARDSAAPGLAPAPARPAAPSDAPPASPSPASSDRPSEAAGRPSSGPRFSLAGYEAATKDLDWAVIGKNMRDMPALTAAFADAYSKTGAIDEEQVGRLQVLNGPLVTAALKANKALKKDSANAAFTHPAFMVNAIAATLEAAGLPLTESQAKAIERLAVDAAAEESRHAQAYDDRTWALEKAIDDSESRERFFAAAFAQLSSEQAAVLVPAATKGRMQVDIFSSALLWSGRAFPLPFADKDALVALAERQYVQHLALGETKKQAIHDAVVEWADALPPEVRDAPADLLSQRGFLPIGLVLDSAKREVALLKRVIDLARLDEAAAKGVRATAFALVPVRTP